MLEDWKKVWYESLLNSIIPKVSKGRGGCFAFEYWELYNTSLDIELNVILGLILLTWINFNPSMDK